MNHAQPIDHSAMQPDLDSYTDLNVGEILKRTREYYGQSLEQVELNLRIRSNQLDALEKLELERLPGRVYAIGFVRAYSEYLGLDGDKMVHLFKAQSVGKRVKPELQFPVTHIDGGGPNVAIILVSLVGVILFIAYWTITYTPTRYVEAIPPVPKTLKQGNLAILKPPVEEPPVSLLETIAPPPNKMELVITSDSWVEIKNAAGEKLISQVLKPGDKYIIPQDQEGLTLSTGNAGGITVFVDGKKSQVIGEPTQVKRNIPLDPMSFTAKE